METNTDMEITALLLWFTAAVLAVALAAVLMNGLAARRRVGTELAAERAGHLGRWAMLALVVAAAAVVFALDVEVPRVPSCAVLALTGMVVAAQPSSRDSIYGALGVRRGWTARGFGELDEWRLIGDHLRWRLGDEWRACRVPSEAQAELRAKLTALCPERESPYK